MILPWSKEDLKLENYHYDLPPHLIAKHPLKKREDCRLLVYKAYSDEIEDRYFHQLPQILPAQSLLVLNNSKVVPCRFKAQKRSGGKAELFILNVVERRASSFVAECLIRARGKKKVLDQFTLENSSIEFQIQKILGEIFLVEVHFPSFEELSERFGHMPIPSYIREGEAEKEDIQDYQTVFASVLGSKAAPTAGLHFSSSLFESLEAHNMNRAEITLHVGMGTFQPVKSDLITEHKMHRESFFIAKENFQKIKENLGNIIAVGTTSLRVLESGLDLPPDLWHSTDIFLHPSKTVNIPRGLITNFHLPKSSLLMLVSALIGRKKALELYQYAIKNEYRFFSYGDAMLILLR